MKKYLKNLGLAMAVVALLLSMASCEKDDNTINENTDAINVNAAVDACSELEALCKQVSTLISETAPTDAQCNSILSEYVDDVVVPTYRLLAEAALDFRDAVNVLKTNNDALHLKAAADAWLVARIYWEESEAFLFGPVGEDAFDIDAHIDSWPLELIDIQEVLANEADGLTGQSAWLLDAEVIGFHTTEYLLFRDGQARASITNAELKYLTAATDALVWDCALAYVAWAGENNVSAGVKNAFNENPDVEKLFSDRPNFQNFGDKLKNATGNYAGSFVAALSEISDGAADIASEVGTTKIESPFINGLVEEVESWYSWHSLDDYQNNIKSIKNAYYGGRNLSTPAATNSLSVFVASKNPQLDSQIKAKITDCITKIAAIGTGGRSFYEVVRDNAK
ncbi:MAG: hypothetical protein LBJ63_06105 [Prevotellaceae bacterium]|jgi:uncharacterized iron-regulated protein|nr:hypothetical protein [Prevotellaceae bacterium]